MVVSDLWVWDPLRWVLISSGLVFAVLSGFCIVWAPFWDQKLRFVALLGYQALTVQLMFRGLGNPLNLYHWLILAISIPAFAGTLMFLVKARRGQREH
jgi:hypothetical protein